MRGSPAPYRPPAMLDVAAILRAFADLAPTGNRAGLDVLAGGEPFLWLGTRHAPEKLAWSGPAAPIELPVGPADPALGRLAATDALYPNERLVRAGWVFLCGRATLDGETRRVCAPLVSRPVRLGRSARASTITPAGDLELLPLVTDPGVALGLEEGAQFGGGAFGTGQEPPGDAELLVRLPRLQRWIRSVAEAAGLELAAILGPDARPSDHRGDDHLVAIVGTALYLARDPANPDVASSLLNWAAVDGIQPTAFGALYDDGAALPPPPGGANAIPSPLPLSRAQREIVQAARGAPVTVVSGPPGTGKSHTVAAIAIDAVARGESVLVATLSDHAADALTDLFRRQPGPVPVLFGNAEQREAIGTQLAGGLGTPVPSAERDVMRDAVHFAERRVRQLEGEVAHRLWIELAADDAPRFAQLAGPFEAQVPAVFAPDADLEAIEQLRAEARAPRRGWWGRWKTRRAIARLGRALGQGPIPDAVLVEALAVARARREVGGLELVGGTVLAPLWAELAQADAALAHTTGSYVDELARALGASSAAGRRAVSALATALRSGRGRRRMLLRQIDGAALVHALPLWVGTLRDIDDLLPTVPGLFDLVVLDEASQVDQIRAAPALLRGRRLVVSGDPHQLRHVTFVADLDVANTLTAHGLDPLADRLDLRRNSVFDAAVAVAPVRWLDAHYRSVPHLIEFSAEHFYRDRVTLMTRHPRNEQLDAIEVVPVSGTRVDGVNRVEVDAVRRIVEELASAGVTSIGVVSPFRAQADALEEMLIERFSVDEIRRLGLRVGTVHTFQGNERDVVVMSFALSPSDGATSRRFVEDPNLFNVLVTRARKKAIVVTSLAPDAGGLLGTYLTHAGERPSPPESVPVAMPWAGDLAAELERNGLRVRVGYPVGRWAIDVCIGDGDDAVALECGVHPEGVPSHLERHRELARAGWELLDAYPSRWEGDVVRAALEVRSAFRART